VALPRSSSWRNRVLSTLPIPTMGGPGASASGRAQHLALQAPTSPQAQTRFWSTLGWSGTGKGRNSCICCGMHCTSLSQPRHRCPGCHFELKQASFTATYRPRQCLLTSKNTFFSICRAGLVEPHGSESCTWHSRGVVTLSMC
jgi:hypothetical protein